LTYPGSSSETFYWDRQIVGEQPNPGGWGPKVLGGTDGPRYGEESPNNTWYLQDFEYYLDYSGETNTDVHTFHVGGFYQTYTNLSGDENITSDEISPERNIDQCELSLSVVDQNGNPRDDVRLNRYNPNTKFTFLKTKSKYNTWVENNLGQEGDRRDVIEAINKDPDSLDPKPDSVGAIDIISGFSTGIGFVYPPARIVAAAATGVGLINDLTNEEKCGELDNATDNSDELIFDPCEDVVLMGYVVEYELNLTGLENPSDATVQLDINQSVSLDGASYYAPGTASWTTTLEGGEQYFTLSDSSTS